MIYYDRYRNLNMNRMGFLGFLWGLGFMMSFDEIGWKIDDFWMNLFD